MSDAVGQRLAGVPESAPAAVRLDELSSVRRASSLREAVADAVRAALVAGQMQPGLVYSAPTLAARFGVSPTPVREAMLDLAKEGLVEVVRNKGFRVTELSDADLDEITELRRLIEVPTVSRLAGRLRLADLEPLRNLADEIVDAARSGDLIAYVETDSRLHLDLLALAGNARIVSTVRDLRMRTRLYGLEQLAAHDQLVSSAEEHVRLLDLLAAGDTEPVAALMHHHLGHVRGSWAGRPERPTA